MPFSFRNLFGWAGRNKPAPTAPVSPEPFDVLDEDRELSFLLGEWVNVTSSWIESAHYIAESTTLEIQIKGGAYYTRGNVSEGEAQDFIRSPSAGTWIWQNGWRTGEFVRLTAVSPPLKR